MKKNYVKNKLLNYIYNYKLSQCPLSYLKELMNIIVFFWGSEQVKNGKTTIWNERREKRETWNDERRINPCNAVFKRKKKTYRRENRGRYIRDFASVKKAPTSDPVAESRNNTMNEFPITVTLHEVVTPYLSSSYWIVFVSYFLLLSKYSL